MTITALTSKRHPPSVGISGLTQNSTFRRGARLCARLITGASAQVQNLQKIETNVPFYTVNRVTLTS